jgi:hypothetical protein
MRFEPVSRRCAPQGFAFQRLRAPFLLVSRVPHSNYSEVRNLAGRDLRSNPTGRRWSLDIA